ncbi:MAG: zinc ABC transporter substrate-binding protein [Pseudomonadota bacterium]|nr:zinc ABC transporter substrate-binding protein [Pseudomonadota bacterium]
MLFRSMTAIGLLATQAQAEVPNVVADLAPVHSLVARVMQGVGEPTMIMQQGASPHGYTLRPSEAAALQDADVVFWVGEELSPWLETAVDSLAGDAHSIELLHTDGTNVLNFREEVVFGEDGDHEGHDDHHGHGHGAHAFEWAGLFDLKAGTYNWSFAKVDGDYADPAMKMVVLAADDIEAVEETAEELLEADASTAKADGEVLSTSDVAYSLNFDAAKDVTNFTVEIAADGTYAFFTEHMPFEFEADEHFFKDTTGADVEPVAQEPEMDHDHGHDDHHGEEKHADHDDHGHEEGHKDHDDHHDEHKDEHADHDDHGHDEHGHDDHGHDHDGADPHAWLSPDNAINWLKVIAEELSEHDPANAELYATNAAAGATEIAAASEAIAAKLAPLSEGRFLVFHDAYQYFEATYGIQATGSLHLSDATPPSAARLVELQAEIKEHGISCVFAEPQFNDDLVAAITPEGTNRGILDPLATDIPAGPALYTAWLNGMAQAVVDCVK